MKDERKIYTIGHSTRELSEFIHLLQLYGVESVVDVRSQPYSRLEHFRRDNLKAQLKSAGIDYVFLGRELGARREEPECYVGSRVSYGRVAQLPAFQAGLERLERAAAKRAVALMCAEREPLDCHRTILVARQLAARGWRVLHILADGSLESHADTEKRMIDAMGVDPLFDCGLSSDELKERAYEERGQEIAFRAGKEELLK